MPTRQVTTTAVMGISTDSDERRLDSARGWGLSGLHGASAHTNSAPGRVWSTYHRSHLKCSSRSPSPQAPFPRSCRQRMRLRHHSGSQAHAVSSPWVLGCVVGAQQRGSWGGMGMEMPGPCQKQLELPDVGICLGLRHRREIRGLGHFSCCRTARRRFDGMPQVAQWGRNFWP